MVGCTVIRYAPTALVTSLSALKPLFTLPVNPRQVIVGDVFSTLGRNTFGADSLLANRRVIIAAIGLGLLLPLCFIKRLGALAALSSIAVAGFLYTSGIVILTALKVSVFWGAGLLLRAQAALVSIAVAGFLCTRSNNQPGLSHLLPTSQPYAGDCCET